MKRSSFCSTKMIWCLLLTMALVCLIMNCSRSPKPTENEVSVSVIKSLVIVPPTIQEGGTGVVDVVVEDDANNPVSGIIVSFSVSPSDIGSCSPQVDTTDASGSAGTVFTATSPGIAIIRASVEGEATKSIQVEVVASETSTKPLSIEITPAVLQADGISTSQINVTVSDTFGNPAKDGTVVKFTAGEKFEDTDGDGYFTEGIDELKYDVNQDGRWNAIGFIPSYGLTQNGEVEVNYIAGVRTGTAWPRRERMER